MRRIGTDLILSQNCFTEKINASLCTESRGNAFQNIAYYSKASKNFDNVSKRIKKSLLHDTLNKIWV